MEKMKEKMISWIRNLDEGIMQHKRKGEAVPDKLVTQYMEASAIASHLGILSYDEIRKIEIEVSRY